VYVLIVGGGKVGLNLARTLLDKGHEVTVLEQRPARVQTLERLLGETVARGNGTLPSVLDAVGCARADVLAAVTGDDATNLLIAVLGTRHFGVGRTIARLNDPRNELLFRRSGVDALVSSSTILAELIEREVAAARVRTILSFPSGGAAIVQVDVSPRSPAAGALVRDIAWPSGTLLVMVHRDKRVLVPGGATGLEVGDRLVLVAPADAEEALQALLAPDAE